jgi:hypothetical protein
MTGSRVTVTGKRVEAEFFIAFYNASRRRLPGPGMAGWRVRIGLCQVILCQVIQYTL